MLGHSELDDYAEALEYAEADDSAEELGFVELPGHTEPDEVAGEVVVRLGYAVSLDFAGQEHVDLPGIAGSQEVAEPR